MLSPLTSAGYNMQSYEICCKEEGWFEFYKLVSETIYVFIMQKVVLKNWFTDAQSCRK